MTHQFQIQRRQDVLVIEPFELDAADPLKPKVEDSLPVELIEPLLSNL